MKLQLTQAFPCTPAQMWEILHCDEFEQLLHERSGVTRETLRDETIDGVRYIEQSIITDKEIPGPMRRAAGMDFITYVQISEINFATNVMKWRVIPPTLKDRINISGETRARATATGCDRIIDGVVEIKVPLLGRKMERALVEGTLETYQFAGDAARQVFEGRTEL